jgi:TonB family protein
MRIRQIPLICLFCLSVALPAQTTDADLNARLMNKPLYLRGFWRDDKLHFDPTGHLRGTSLPVTFTLSGFESKKVQLKQDKLILEGKRIGLEFSGNKQTRVALLVGDPRDHEEEMMDIEIDAPPNGDYGAALDAIFIEGLADIVPSLPSYWKTYAGKTFLLDVNVPQRNLPAASSTRSTPQPSLARDAQLKRIGGGVSAPTVLNMAEPTFNEVARKLKYGGAVLINLWVRPDGTPDHLSVVRALGLGLDEAALAAVQKYRFNPAMQDGKPVMVELNIEVNFQIY